KLCEWAAHYYHYSFGEILASAMPALFRKGETLIDEIPKQKIKTLTAPHILTNEQKIAVDEIVATANTFKVFLLNGVTGSGKTEVYLQAMQAILAQDKQVLVLVPEISLTPQ